MLKKALYTYARGYHPGNIKKNLSGNFYWQLFYVFIFLPSINFRDIIWDDGFNTAIYYILVMCICLMEVAEAATPLTLQKQMFLCPLQEAQRKQYVKYLLCCKLLIPILVLGIFVGIPVYIAGKNIVLFGVTLFSVFSLLLASILERATHGGDSWVILYVVIVILNALSIIIGILEVLQGGGFPLGIQGYVILFLVIPLILDIWIGKRGIPVAMENAMNYEYSIRGK